MVVLEDIENDIRQIKFIPNDLNEFDLEFKEKLLFLLKNYKVHFEFGQMDKDDSILNLKELILQNNKTFIENYFELIKTIGLSIEDHNKLTLVLSFDNFFDRYSKNNENEYHKYSGEILNEISRHLNSNFNSFKDTVLSKEEKYRDIIKNLIEQKIFKKNELVNCISVYYKNSLIIEESLSKKIYEYESIIHKSQEPIYDYANDINELKSSFSLFKSARDKQKESAVLLWTEAIKNYWNILFNLEINRFQIYLIKIIQDELKILRSKLDDIQYLINYTIRSLEQAIYFQKEKEREFDRQHSYEGISNRICETNPSYIQARGYCSCHDGSLVPLIITKNSKNNYDIYSMSNVQGMGMGGYENKIFENDFSDYYILNSFNGVSYVCLRKRFWGLLKLNQNLTSKNFFGVDWELVTEFKFLNIEELLTCYGIDKSNFSV